MYFFSILLAETVMFILFCYALDETKKRESKHIGDTYTIHTLTVKYSTCLT